MIFLASDSYLTSCFRFPGAKNFVIATRQLSKESWEELQAGAETGKSPGRGRSSGITRSWHDVGNSRGSIHFIQSVLFQPANQGGYRNNESVKSFSGFCQMVYRENIIQTCYILVFVTRTLQPWWHVRDQGLMWRFWTDSTNTFYESILCVFCRASWTLPISARQRTRRFKLCSPSGTVFMCKQ